MSPQSLHLTRPSLGLTVALSVAALLAALSSASLVTGDTAEQLLLLPQAGPVTGPFARTTQRGEVEIEVLGGRTRLEFMLFGLTPNAVHSVWLEWDTARPPFSGTGEDLLATDPETGTTANVYAYTPAAPDNAAFTGGMGLDPNGFVADDSGNALFRLELNYDIFQPQAAPVVLRPGATQTVRVASSGGACVGSPEGALASRIDSAYMRVFNTSTVANLPARSPSFPVLSAPLRARLVRGAVREIRVVEHFDGVTHGHLRGVGSGQGGNCRDHEFRLSGLVANAVPKR